VCNAGTTNGALSLHFTASSGFRPRLTRTGEVSTGTNLARIIRVNRRFACILFVKCISYLTVKGQSTLQLGFTVIFYALVCCPIFAQSSWKAEHCQRLARESEHTGPNVIIDDIVLDGDADVPEPVWNRAVSQTKGERFSGDGWVDEVSDVFLVAGLQNQGYFKASITATPELVSSSPTLQHFILHVNVRGGAQFRLSSVQIRSSDPSLQLAFSTEELRSFVPMQDGDVFGLQKVREGLEALERHYNSHGYRDFVASLEMSVDEMHQQIALILSLQEGFQFRVGTIDVVGLNSALESELRSKIKSGETLNLELIENFYHDHKSELPEEVLPFDTVFHENVKERTADVFFDFRSCSQLQTYPQSSR
jgi:outer membrane protein assembly factor BamA